MQDEQRRGAAVPPMPEHAPAVRASLADWLRIPRPQAPLGVWRAGYVPRAVEEPDRTPSRQLALGGCASLVAAWVLGSFLWNGYLGSYWLWPMLALTPDSWRGEWGFVIASWLYYAIVLAVLVGVFGRLGSWGESLRRFVAWVRIRESSAGAGAVPRPRTSTPPPVDQDPAAWPELRHQGAVGEADQLTAELRSGQMTDVDHARIRNAWLSAAGQAERRAAVLEDVRRRGGRACPHGSGARDLPVRSAQQDLMTGQVRVGKAVEVHRNPHAYRGVGVALEPRLLGTSLLAVGPSGAGKTARIVRPVAEALCAQALAGQAAVVVVTDRGASAVPDEWFDVVLRLTGGEGSGSLDLYGGSTDPDEAAAIAAEALVGDLVDSLPGGDSRAAAVLLAQLIGPWRALYERWPDVSELRDLLDGGEPLTALQAALESKALRGQQRELGAYVRQSSGPLVPLLAGRVAVLDRPALAGLVAPSADGVSVLDRLDRAVRVRVDLPSRMHVQAGRILARLAAARFAAAVATRAGRTGLFAGLVLDDATQAITPETVRTIQHLRGENAGMLLTVRTMADVPEQLRGPLVGAVGCRVICAGVTPWDAQHFAEAWGTEWVETRAVTDRQLVGHEPAQKVMYGLRKLATGRHVTAQSVTTRQEQRQRWPASDLATEVPGGHAVMSVTTIAGERSSPILVKLGE